MKRALLLIVSLLYAGILVANDVQLKYATSPAEQFVDSLMKKMSLEDKISQMNQLAYRGAVTGIKHNSNLLEKIRQGKVGSILSARGAKICRDMQRVAVEESPLGIPLLFGLDVIHGYNTTFPIPLGMASSWNMEAIERASRIAAIEASASGLAWTFTPMVDICHDARWGRIAEGAGEDPYLGSRIAEAQVRGFQGDMTQPNNIATCVKHFALYGASEAGRDYNTVDMSLQKMMNEFMPPYKAAVDAGALTVMTSFNEINGVPASVNKWLLKDLLRDSWGFKGMIVSDYTAIEECLWHGVGTIEEIVARAANATVDMDMVGESYSKYLLGEINKGNVSPQVVDDACRRILLLKYKLGLFADPYRNCREKEEESYPTKGHLKAAREIAAESMVLLKNENNLLPLNSKQKIAVIGPLADLSADMLGMWSIKGKLEPTSVYKGLVNALGKKRVEFAQGCHCYFDEKIEKLLSPRSSDKARGRDRSAEELKKEALDVAARNDVIVAVMGEVQNFSGEGASRVDITIGQTQRDLLKALVATGKPIVLVVTAGRPLVLDYESENVGAILNAWHAGTEAGNAVADILLGKVNPSGKITASFPRHIAQLPIHYNHKNTGRPHKGDAPFIRYKSTYIDVLNSPLYPFGYGLSYTTFEYSVVNLSASSMAYHDKLVVSVDVRNTGNRDGAEVVQLYLRDVMSASTRPVRELKGFRKVWLRAGESQRVEFTLTVEDLKYWDQKMEFVAEPGDFEVYVGGCSTTTNKAVFTLKK